MQVIDNVKKNGLSGTIADIFKFQPEKPTVICQMCGVQIEPQGYCEKLGGYPVIQPMYCDSCMKIIEQQERENELKRKRAERLPVMRDMAISTGAPPEKVLKAKFDDFNKFKVVHQGKEKKVNFRGLFDMLIENKVILITGKSGSGKSHLGTLLYLGAIWHFADVPADKFEWNTLIKLTNEVISHSMEEDYITRRIRSRKVFSFVFGEYADELNGSDAVQARRDKLLFTILDDRLEFTNYADIYTILMTSYTPVQLIDLLGYEYYRRVIEIALVIDMGESRKFSEKMFEQRPLVEAL